MIKIKKVDAWEILDSRGRPTVAAGLTLDDETTAAVSVPSGASTGRAEAKELRDGGKRFRGLGCHQAVANIRGPIAAALKNTPRRQRYPSRFVGIRARSGSSPAR
jgi:enolase